MAEGAGLLRALAAPLRWGSAAWRPSFLPAVPGRGRPALLPHPPPAPLPAAAAAPWGARGITVNQLHRRGPFPWPRRGGTGPTEGRPQLKGVVLKTMVRKPKKPNSANRKCARVRLSTGKEAVVFIPGQGHNLQEHSVVLVEGGRTQDLPGLKMKVIRGKYDCAHVKKK